MKSEISMGNESFKFLENSSSFLRLIVNNISSCIILLDKDMRLRAFNPVLKTIFSNKKDEHLLYRKCGEAIGCAHQIEENKECGKTSKCTTCELRLAALTSYMENKPIYKDKITRPFYTIENEKVDKHLQFSTRLFIHNSEKYIFIIVEDISPLVEMRQKIENMN